MDKFVQAYASTPLLRDDADQLDTQSELAQAIGTSASGAALPAIPRFEIPNVHNVRIALLLGICIRRSLLTPVVLASSVPGLVDRCRFGQCEC